MSRQPLAAAINGTISGWWQQMSGDVAKSVKTVWPIRCQPCLAAHVSILLWFDDQLTPHLQPSKPPTAVELAHAKWGIGGQGVWLWGGQVWPGSARRWRSIASASFCSWRLASASRHGFC